MSTTVVFLVPKAFTWDKYCAMYLATRAHVPEEGWRDFGWGAASLLAACGVHLHFEDEDPAPADFLDIDVRSKYTATGHGSATEAIVERFGLQELPGIRHLVKVLGANNKSGYLKDLQRFPMSFVWLIRELFGTGGDEQTRTARLEVIRILWPTVRVYFEAAEKDEGRVENLENPFTLHSFLQLCDVAALPRDRVERWREELVRAFQRAERARSRARERAAELPATAFPIRVHGQQRTVVGHFIRTDNMRVPAKYFRAHREVMLLVTRNSHGRHVVFVRGLQDLAGLQTALDAIQPGCAFLDERPESPQLFDGGSGSRDGTPSGLSEREFVALVQQHYEHRTRDQR